MLFLKLFNESFRFAIHALSVNKLRTTLSLLGITIGIFAIITVFTVVDSLERNVRNDVAKLGDEVIYIQKWPWGTGGDYPWWKYFRRPVPLASEMEQLEKKVQSAEAVAFVMDVNRSLSFQSNIVENVSITGASANYDRIVSFDLSEGRYFTPQESAGGRNLVILGADVAEGLFPNVSPIGKEVKMMGRRLKVIGVFEKMGSSMIGNSMDENALVPLNWAAKLFDLRSERVGGYIMVKGKSSVSMEQLKDEVRGQMRAIRRLKPKADDDFSLNEVSMLSAGMEATFSTLGIAGWIIGGFSILVGGFGIANIMFVSVKERTNQIGIQKSLGAKRYFILLQFLFESVVLCLLGGLAGLALVALVISLVESAINMGLGLSTGNVVLGIVVSVIIGLISGSVPAYSASRLDPVEAIRSGI